MKTEMVKPERERLIDLVKLSGRRLVAPLMGYPGIQITRTSIKQNEFNWGAILDDQRTGA
jgi:hypothetical protein